MKILSDREYSRLLSTRRLLIVNIALTLFAVLTFASYFAIRDHNQAHRLDGKRLGLDMIIHLAGPEK